MYELHYSYPCGGWISKDGDDTGVFIQGEDYYNLEAEVESVEKLVRWKKIGRKNAQSIIDSILENYCE